MQPRREILGFLYWLEAPNGTNTCFSNNPTAQLIVAHLLSRRPIVHGPVLREVVALLLKASPQRAHPEFAQAFEFWWISASKRGTPEGRSTGNSRNRRRTRAPIGDFQGVVSSALDPPRPTWQPLPLPFPRPRGKHEREKRKAFTAKWKLGPRTIRLSACLSWSFGLLCLSLAHPFGSGWNSTASQQLARSTAFALQPSYPSWLSSTTLSTSTSTSALGIEYQVIRASVPNTNSPSRVFLTLPLFLPKAKESLRPSLNRRDLNWEPAKHYG
ncbi:hypothetical protein QBC46DRAFT_59572 [Diplogelasinospora grovesii]|uniref:Uncharacterized protein n=1 Tax=Diplogelasinospora grovesii TaxID=303347 RepID=A0AAN6MXV7_9PEZI|nr:hypothetical protein QBC46DRAFT_59572 [Diplogelasinospora grovesii]